MRKILSSLAIFAALNEFAVAAEVLHVDEIFEIHCVSPMAAGDRFGVTLRPAYYRAARGAFLRLDCTPNATGYEFNCSPSLVEPPEIRQDGWLFREYASDVVHQRAEFFLERRSHAGFIMVPPDGQIRLDCNINLNKPGLDAHRIPLKGDARPFTAAIPLEEPRER
jgi:hypothetical protein